MIRVRPSRTNQPQGTAEIDWGNPLTRGLTRVLRCQGAQIIDMLTPTGEPSGIAETGTFLAQGNPGGFGRRNNTTTRANYTLVPPKTETISSVTIVWSGVVNAIGGTTYPFFRNSQTQVFTGGSGNAFWGTRFGSGTNQISATAIKLRTPTTYLFTQSGAIGSLFVDGNAALLNVTGTAGGTFPNPHAIDGNYGFAQSNDITTNVMLIYSRPMTAQEAASLSANPWQIFKPVERRIYFDADAGGGSVVGNASGSLVSIGLAAATATANGSTVIPATGTASLAAISLIASQSGAYGVGSASSALDSVGLTATNATASGGTSIPATGSGALVGISLASTQGLANGSALASAALENVSLTPATGSASAGTSIPGNASASLASASITPASAQATAAATAAGPIIGMNLTPAQAQAASEAWASAQMVAIGLTAATGTANNLPNDFEPADQWRTLTIERSTRIMVVRRDDRTLIVQRQNRVAKA